MVPAVNPLMGRAAAGAAGNFYEHLSETSFCSFYFSSLFPHVLLFFLISSLQL